MESKTNKAIMIVAIVVVAVVALIMGVMLIQKTEELNRMDKIIEASCNASGDYYACKLGMKTLKEMPTSEIEGLINRYK